MLFRPTTRSLTVLAPAKLNLFLRVVAKRPDGYHDIESVMAAVNLYDTLMLEEADSDEVQLSILDGSARTRSGAMLLEAPVGPDNLVIRAAMLLRDATGCGRGARMTLVKRIPSSAGLGGGSSDAAAALAGLNRMWNLNLSRAELLELASRLGSDVAFFLAESPVALCTGRGERIEPLRVSTGLHFVVVKPLSGLSTPAVYQRCVPDTEGRSAEDVLAALSEGSVGRMARRLHNGLQAPAESVNPDVRRLGELFETLPVAGHQMSGSGSSYFGVCASQFQALAVAGRLRARGVPWVRIVRICP